MHSNSGFKIATVIIIALIISIAKPATAAGTAQTPAISIIIDDIGYRIHEDLRSIAIPGPLAYAIMPLSPYAHKMSRLATKNGKQVLLHLPMESSIQDKNRLLGPGALMFNMNKNQFMRTLNIDLNSLPLAVGVNNHMGSLLTSSHGRMEWLMKSLKLKNKFYIDSMTSRLSVASDIARENSVPYLKRDVFLDNEQNQDYVMSQLLELIRLAKTRGTAVAIGHPHPVTIQVLTREIQDLDKYGVRLVSLTDLMKIKIRSDTGSQHIAAISN